MLEQIDLPIIPIGSSRGIRIPKRILERLGLKDHTLAIISDDAITLKPVSNPRDGWEADAKRCHALGEDTLDIPDDIDADLWKDL